MRSPRPWGRASSQCCEGRRGSTGPPGPGTHRGTRPTPPPRRGCAWTRCRSAGVGEATRRGLAGSRRQVCVGEDDERVGASELEDGLLHVDTGQAAHRLPGSFGAGEGDSLDERARDHLCDLLVAGKDVLVHVIRRPRSGDDVLDLQRLLWAVAGVLEQDRVAQQEVRRHEAGHLVVREVPRHDAHEAPMASVRTRALPLPAISSVSSSRESGPLVA